MADYYIVTMSVTGSDDAIFWKPNSSGYTRFVEQAGKYSEEKAKRICHLRGQEYMIPCGEVESRELRVVPRESMYDFFRDQGWE